MTDAKDMEQAAQRVSDARGYLRIDDKRAELARLDEESAAPGFWDDAAHAQSVSKQASNLRDTIREYEEAAALLEDARAALGAGRRGRGVRRRGRGRARAAGRDAGRT